MALSPITSATKPIKTPGLFDAAKMGGKSYEDWEKTGSSEFPSIAPAQIKDDVSSRVTEITKTDSPLMTAARTEGLKVANSRGLLNSSMAAGASQDAMIRAAVPIASQEASQAYGKNQAARAFEFSMASQDDAQGFAGEQAGMDRSLQRDMQGREIDFQQAEARLDRGLQEKLASWNLASSDRNAAATFLTNMESMYNSTTQSIMANTNLTAEQRTQQIASARALRDRQLNFVEQMYDVDLEWGAPAPPPGPTTTPTPLPDQGSKVLCTYFHAKGMLDPTIYAADLAYAEQHVSANTVTGYHAWVVPLVGMIETGKHPVIERIVLWFVRQWAGEMARVMGVTGKSSLTGRAMRVLGEPLCSLIGHFSAKGRAAAI